MEPFDAPLGPDPDFALIPPAVDPFQVGPAYRAQYVVELVGSCSVPAQAAASLLTQSWQNVFGSPELYAMSAADPSWTHLQDRQTGSYDSLALAWDILSPRGRLTRQSAHLLFEKAEQFAEAIGRRAAPLPVPDEMDKVANDLLKIQEQLDIGVSLAVISRAGAVSERDLWVICSKLGLSFSPGGSFDWRAATHPSPLLSVTPIGSVDSFSLRQVQAGTVHEGVTVGFNLGRCPAPLTALDGALKVCRTIAQATNGAVVDDCSDVLTPSLDDEMRRNLQIGVEALESVGLKPGSPSSLKIF